MAAGCAIYAALGFIIYRSNLAGNQWGIVNSYWNALNNVVTPLAFMVLFGERYDGWQWLGFLLVAAGVLLIGK